MNEISIPSPAKLNLFLEVLGRRPDGYHEVRTVMQEIDLADEVRIWLRPVARPAAPTPNPITLPTIQFECRWHPRMTSRPSEPLPTGPDNIAFRAAKAVLEEVGSVRARTLRQKELGVRVLKRIPLASGMGGGSSNAAATLLGLDRLLGLRLSRRSLLSLAAGLGSDVPFFLNGGMALCTGRGEKTKQLCVAANLHFVILVPPWGLSTACVYEEFDSAGKGATDIAPNPAICSSEFPVCSGSSRLEAFLAALKRGDLVEIGRTMFNSLEAPVFRLEPRMALLKERMEKIDFLRVMITGSGSAIFGLCRSASHAARCARRLRQLRLGNVIQTRGASERRPRVQA